MCNLGWLAVSVGIHPPAKSLFKTTYFNFDPPLTSNYSSIGLRNRISLNGDIERLCVIICNGLLISKKEMLVFFILGKCKLKFLLLLWDMTAVMSIIKNIFNYLSKGKSTLVDKIARVYKCSAIDYRKLVKHIIDRNFSYGSSTSADISLVKPETNSSRRSIPNLRPSDKTIRVHHRFRFMSFILYWLN